jgi:two-component system response regulator
MESEKPSFKKPGYRGLLHAAQEEKNAMNQSDEPDILIVEDNPNDAELMMRAFKKQNISGVIRVLADGAEALDFLFAKGAYASRRVSDLPKVMLLDVKLPKVDGFEVLKTVKDNPVTRMLPVVMVTSSREDPDIGTAYGLGANSYVTKPVDYDSFTSAIGLVGRYWLSVNRPPR